jgi:hypothetical protein
MQELPFITENPATAEYNRANKVAADLETADLEAERLKTANKAAAFKLQTEQQEAPTRLRMLGSQADLAGTNAQTAAAKAPYAGPEAQAQLAQTRASTASTIAAMNNNQARLHMDAFTRSIELLDAGDIDGAKRVSASVGDTIPDQVIANSQLRGGIKNVIGTAQQLYPSRPKDQMAYITAHIHELAARGQQGQPVNPQTAPYEQVPGAPVPPEVGGHNQATGETERIIARVMQENPKLSYQEALGIAKRAPHGDEMTIRRETLALNAAKADSSDLSTLETWRQKYGLPPFGGAQGTQGAAGTAPPRPGNVPQGSAYSPSRQMWRDPQGNLYDANGAPVRAQTQAPAEPEQTRPNNFPSVPMSQ